LLKDKVDALLPTFTGGCPVPHPNWEHGVARTDLPQLQPLLEIVRGLLQKGLTGEEILWTFLGHGVQLLPELEAAMGMSLGPSCLVHHSFSRLDSAEANARAHETLPPEDSVGHEARRSCHRASGSHVLCRGASVRRLT
jgi:hypothetical protein